VPLAGEATKVPRIGFLAAASFSEPQIQRSLQAFRQGLRELGYVESQSIAIEFRSTEGQYERLPGLAAELVRPNVDVIVAAGTRRSRRQSKRPRRSPSSWLRSLIL
jgi:putative ABC transport system substrate-binding protein